MKEIRVGAVGVGNIFTHCHLPAYARLPEAKLVAMADPSERSLRRALAAAREAFQSEAERLRGEGRDEEAREMLKAASEIRVYKDYREMLSREEVDLVDICTPHKYHKEIAVEALRAGVNVMVEKPMARTYLEALEIVEAARDSKKLFQLNENYVFAGGFYKVRKLIQAGELGEVCFLIVPCSHEGPEGTEWFWNPELGGGGALLDLGSHAVAVAWYLIGLDRKPELVKAEKFAGVSLRARERYVAGGFKCALVEDDAHVLVKFRGTDDSWATALIEASWCGPEYECTMAFGSRGSLKVRGAQGKAVVELSDYVGRRRVIEVPQEVSSMDTFTYEIAYMCRCVSSGSRSFLNEEVGAEVMAVVDAAYYSEMQGRRAVTLDEFKEFSAKLAERFGDRASDEFIKMKVRHVAGQLPPREVLAFAAREADSPRLGRDAA